MNRIGSGTSRDDKSPHLLPNKGHYYYHCALHNINGMYGEVIVQ